jgi:hypothetical protein
MPGTDRNHRCAGWWKAFTIREKSLELGSGSGTYCGYTQPAKVVRKTLILVPFFEDHGEGLRIPPSPPALLDSAEVLQNQAFLEPAAIARWSTPVEHSFASFDTLGRVFRRIKRRRKRVDIRAHRGSLKNARETQRRSWPREMGAGVRSASYRAYARVQNDLVKSLRGSNTAKRSEPSGVGRLRYIADDDRGAARRWRSSPPISPSAIAAVGGADLVSPLTPPSWRTTRRSRRYAGIDGSRSACPPHV